MPSAAMGLLFILVITVVGMSVPIVALLVKHQQKMATILRGNAEPRLAEEVAYLRHEIAELRAAVGSLKAELGTVRHESENELTSRLRGVS